jgi:hypothetical protein
MTTVWYGEMWKLCTTVTLWLTEHKAHESSFSLPFLFDLVLFISRYAQRWFVYDVDFFLH